MKKVMVLLSAGFEELEAVTAINVLRRANVNTDVVGYRDIQLTGSRNITLVCDEVFDYYSSLDYDAIVFVGGVNNAVNLSSDEHVLQLLRDYMGKGKIIAGICATPALVFSKSGILKGKTATCYPSEDFIANLQDEYVDKTCVVCDNLITSQSPDTAMEFALTIVQKLGLDAGAVYDKMKGK